MEGFDVFLAGFMITMLSGIFFKLYDEFGHYQTEGPYDGIIDLDDEDRIILDISKLPLSIRRVMYKKVYPIIN
jgi:hypothetical protein